MFDPTTLHSYFQDRAAQDQFSGVVRITQGETELFAAAYGWASRAWRAPNTMATRFDTASITKLFTAVAALQMVDAGHFTLDTPVIPYLGLTDTTISAAVTVGHLLTHTSGIGDDADEEAGEDYAELWRTKPNYSIQETVDFLPQFIHKPANFPPGAGCRYNNCGYILLGLMVEKAGGLPYRDYVRQKVFAPAGMTRADFFHMADVHEDVAEGADPVQDETGRISGWRKSIYAYPPIGSPDGGAHVTAADLDRFLRAVRTGRLLSPAATRAFLTPQVDYRAKDGWTMRYGYGLWFYVRDDDAVVCYQKEGVNAGASGLIRYFPAQDITVVMLANMAEAVWAPVWHVHGLIVEGG